MQPISVKEIPSKWNKVQVGISNDKQNTVAARHPTLSLVSQLKLLILTPILRKYSQNHPQCLDLAYRLRKRTYEDSGPGLFNQTGLADFLAVLFSLLGFLLERKGSLSQQKQVKILVGWGIPDLTFKNFTFEFLCPFSLQTHCMTPRIMQTQVA